MNCDTNAFEAGLDYFIKLNKVRVINELQAVRPPALIKFIASVVPSL